MADLERKILVAMTAKKIEDMIRESLRELGDILKNCMDVDSKKPEFQLFALTIYGEAVEVLRMRAQKATETEKK